VQAGRSEPGPVRTIRNTPNQAGVTPEGADFLAGLHVPELHCAVPTGGGEPLPVRAEGHVADLPGVAPDGAFHLAGRRATDLCRAVPTRQGELRPLGTEGSLKDSTFLSCRIPEGRDIGCVLDGASQLARERVPDRDDSLAPAGGNQALAIAA